jgi:integrase
LREKLFDWTITAMLQSRTPSALSARVNVIKKVKVNGQWKFCPVVIEPGGRLKDRVRINGHTAIHLEGVYYIEWRENGQRRRQAIPNRNEVLGFARRKALELETARIGMPALLPAAPPEVGPPPASVPYPEVALSSDVQPLNNAAGMILKGIESYLQGLMGAALQSHLGRVVPDPALPCDASLAICAPPPHKLPEVGSVDTQSPVEGKQKGSDSPNRNLIAEAVESFLKDFEPPRREPRTYSQYRFVLHTFRDTCKKQYLDEIDRSDCLAFMDHLYSVENEARTVANRMGVVEQFLRRNGVAKLLEKGDKPKYVEGLREMYQPEDLEALFKACTPDQKVLYMFFLLTGERDQEVQYTTWSDIDFVRKKVRVTEKKRLGFKPKDKEEREIPVPSQLLTALKEYRERRTGPNPHNLVFPTSNGRPDKKFENKLKKIAKRAGLNCGHCVSKYDNKCSEGPYCGKWFLHKFRHTFATTSLESGASIRQLQGWLGHSDLESTMIYLKFVQRKDIQNQLDNSEMAQLAAQTLGIKNTGVPSDEAPDQAQTDREYPHLAYFYSQGAVS